jgi:hypothetical protein
MVVIMVELPDFFMPQEKQAWMLSVLHQEHILITHFHFLRRELLMTVYIKTTVFWDELPCSLVDK